MRFIVTKAFFGAALIVGFSTASSAATLSMSTDKLTYLVGETITLSIDGDAQGANAYFIYGRLLYDGSLVDNGTRTQKTIGTFWSKNSLEAGDTNANSPTSAVSEAFDQISAGFPQTATNPISTVTLIAQSVG